MLTLRISWIFAQGVCRPRLGSPDVSTSPRLNWRAEPGPSWGSRVKVALIVAAGIALFASAGIGVKLLVWNDPAGTTELVQARPTTSVASALRKPTGGLDTFTRRAKIGPATLTLPGEPYDVYPDPVHIDGVVEVIFLANAEVHPDYDGRHDWLATVALAQISPQLVGSSDLDQAGARVLEELGDRFFGGQVTQIKRMRTSDRAVDGHPGMEFHADVHYSAKGLPSSHDRAVVRLVRCDDGSLIAAISSVPNDASPQIRALASAAIDSLSLS
jgi:hypothetical protein